MLKVRPAQDEANLLRVSQDAGRIITEAIRSASVVPTLYSQVAAGMISVANGTASLRLYEPGLRDAFVRHGVLPPAMARTVVAATRAAAAVAAPALVGAELPPQQLSVDEYGLGISKIMVYAAAQPKRYNVTGAALDVGAMHPPSENAAAKSFFEDLLRRGKLKLPDSQDGRTKLMRAAAPSVAPSAPETHTHELRKEGSQIVLRRMRIDCCCCDTGKVGNLACTSLND